MLELSIEASSGLRNAFISESIVDNLATRIHELKSVNILKNLSRKRIKMLAIRQWLAETFSGMPLDLVGLIALADISAVARITALSGTRLLTDTLVLCPGFHRQQDASDLSRGEYPICAAMTTGYVFRVENEAMVFYMQSVGKSGQLTRLTVSKKPSPFHGASTSQFAYLGAMMLSVVVIGLLFHLEDKYALEYVWILMFARFLNVVVTQRRAVMGWKGEPEPGKQSDLIVLLSQDRWIRLQGAVDDVKAVTSSQWLRKSTVVESACVAFATLMVYLNVSLAYNASREGKILLAVLLFSSAGLLGLASECTQTLIMYGRTVAPDGPPKPYSRRLVLTEKLVKETGTSDWAIRLGMAKPEDIAKWKEAAGSKANPSDRDDQNLRNEMSAAEVADIYVKL